MSIDSCYRGIIEKLTKQGSIMTVTQQISCLDSINDKVLFVHDLIKTLNSFPKLLEVAKCDTISTYYRNLGNKMYQQSKDYMAWQYYNLSLMYAPLGSESYCLALANRSAVFYSLGEFAESSNDINEVFKMKYPVRLKEKLEKRQTSCEEKLMQKINEDKSELSSTSTDFILEDPQNPRFPCASSKLQVVFSKEMGRHVVAKTDIKVGEVLVQENPYFTLALESQLLFCCSYCLSRKKNLLPCQSCCFALYCDDKCRNNAWNEYHEIECPLMANLIEMQFTKLELLALRTTIKSRNDHANWNELFRTIEKAEANEESEFRGHVQVNDEWVYDSKYYASIHTLASNVEQRSVSDIFLKAVSAAVFLWLIEQKTTYLESDDEEERYNIRRYVAGTLLLHIMTSPTNMHGLSTNTQTPEGDYVVEIGLASAPYAFHSLLNHSCASNVVRFNKLGTGTMTLFALRPIKKGMQLFDNYGAHHAIHDRLTRQKNLKSQYKFSCLCEACVDNWPLYLTMKPSKNLPANLIKCKDSLLNSEVLKSLQKGDALVAERLFKPLCELTEALDPYAPCQELSDCQETMKQCLQIFHGLLPYGYSCTVNWNVSGPKI